MERKTAMDINTAQVYVNLCSSALAKGFLSSLDDFRVESLKEIAINRHCGNGYYSWDGMFDDLTALTGSEDLAAEILNNI
jgi:hypothetical protein